MPTIHHGDCIETMNAMPPESVDAIVTDPPYGLGFMGRKWDGLPPSLEWAEACYRVLKPGGHIAAFGGTRTWHRLAVAIEDAGFEMRDSLAWLYGSGFPKSLDISKAIDKRPGVSQQPEFGTALRAAMTAKGYTNTFDVAEVVLGKRTGAVANWIKYQFPEARWWPALRDLLDMDEARWGPVIAEADRAKTGRVTSVTGRRSDPSSYAHDENVNEETAPATPEAEQWTGWGTALKPAFEPIVLARKPLAEKTVARNVLAHGTGAINVDACRVAHDEPAGKPSTGPHGKRAGIMGETVERHRETTAASTAGRWPANVLLDQHAAAWVDEQSGVSVSKATASRGKPSGTFLLGGCHTEAELRALAEAGEKTPNGETATLVLARYEASEDRPRGHTDSGGASRFFYSAKAPKSERPNVDGVQHPTVKPLAIMRWLIRLVTPPGGTVLDPFAGSGTTIEAALIEGFNPVGIEMETDYLPLIQHRIDRQAGTLTA